VNANGLIDAAKAVTDIAPGILKTAAVLAGWFTGAHESERVRALALQTRSSADGTL